MNQDYGSNSCVYASVVKQQWWGIMCTALWTCLPTHLDQATPWKQPIPLSDHWCALSGWGESSVCVQLAAAQPAAWGSREEGEGIGVSGSHPVRLCSGSRWKKRHPAARGPPKLSPHRPNQSRGAPSWPLPGLPQQAPESLLGAGSVLSCLPWGHLPLMPPWWF